MMIADQTPQVHDGRSATGQAKSVRLWISGDPEKCRSHAASGRVLCRGSEGPTMANAAQDWTNILKKPFKSDIVWKDYAGGSVTNTEIFPMVVRYEESVLSGGIRFRFGGSHRAALPPPPMMPPPPPPPPVAQPAPVMEEPAPPPPPPPAPERG